MDRKIIFCLIIFFFTATLVHSYTSISGDMSGVNLTAKTYYVAGDLFVNAGTTFTLNPGVVLKFASGTKLTVYGSLSAIGSSSPFIFFTSQNDDTIGETLPFSSGSPQPGDWEGILFDGTSTNEGICDMKYCLVKFGGSSSGTISANIKLKESDSGSIKYSISRFSERNGIEIGTSSPDISNNYIDYNELSGIHIEGTCLATISENNIIYNSYNGIYFGSFSSTPSVTSNTIDNNDPYPLVCYPKQVNNISNNSFSGNTNQQINIKSGTVSEDATWEDPGIPFRIEGVIYIQGQDGIDMVTTLTLEPGITMEFNSNTYLYIGHDTNPLYAGALVAVGTVSDSIKFTTDTASPSPGYWYGIYFAYYADGSISTLDYCLVEYGGYSSYENIFCNNTSPSILNSTIKYGSGSGIYCYQASPSISGCSIAHNSYSGIYCNNISNPVINGCNINENGSYGVDCNMNSEPTIDSCNIIENSSYGIYIHNSSSPTINASYISSNQSFGVYINSASDNASITNSEISNNLSYPVRCYASQVGNITGNTFTGNTYQKIYVYGNTISLDATWENQGIPYYISSSAHVYVQGTDGPDSVTTLMLDPGVELNFDSVYLWIGHTSNPDYKGALIANGTDADKIIITSSSATPAPGDWYGLYFAQYADSSCLLDHCVIEYGGNGSSYNNVRCIESSPTITNCEISKGEGSGIYLNSSQAIISDCEIYDNSENGIYIINANPSIAKSLIYNNNYGIYNVNNTPGTEISNCTITENTKGYYATLNSDATILNSILWGNTTYGVDVQSSSDLEMTYSDCQNYWAGTGNIYIDPVFKNSSIDDYSLSYTSPCIDTGDPASPLDPDSTQADMGAFYFDQAEGEPDITSISDIPADQGHQVQITWDKSIHDDTGSIAPIENYSIWRYDDEYVKNNANLFDNPYDIFKKINNTRTEKFYWQKGRDILTFIAQVPAMGFEEYSYIAPTLYDSSYVSKNFSKFIIFAHTDVTLLYFGSEPDSGYSVDNLPPCETTVNITKGGNSMNLNWQEVEYGMFQGNLYPELNGVWYKIYAGDEPDFICDQDHLIDIVTDLDYEYNINPSETKQFFKIVVSDTPY